MTTAITATPPAAKPLDDVYLDYEGVRDAVAELGFPKPDLVTVVGWRDRKTLPFFKGLDGKCYIAKRTLIDVFRKRQDAAAQKVMGGSRDDPGKATPRRGRPRRSAGA